MRYNNYVTYHLHTEVSLLDSCTNHKLYTDKAVELGQTAIAFTEHGNIFNWVEKKMYCDEMGIKYIHGIEVYLTETIDEEEKVRDNYHTILLAKNYEGVKEINRLFTLSHSESHFYYKPRITFDEFLDISDNVIKTSACLQSPLRYLYRDGSDMSAERRAMFLKVAKHYDYLEIQHHDIEDQKNYNKFLYALSKKIGTPLIAGTDTHNLDKYKAECREMLQYGKEAIFSKESDSEDSINMEYMTYDELVDAYKKQDCLPMDVVLEAINNTNVMADSVESFDLDKSFKYPYLYGKDDKKVLLDTIKKKLQYKIKNNIIDVSRKQEYMDNIKEEIKVFEQIDMIGFMLFMSELITWCWDNNIPVGYGRGSCCGSTVAYITDIIDVDPIKNNTVFSRFANKDRKELGDIDCDFAPDQRDAVFNYIVDRFGKEKTARVLSMGTIKDRACIDVICKAYRIKWKLAGSIGEEPYSLSVADEIKDMYEADEGRARAKYPDIFYYFDGLVNTTISQSCHPAGILASPIDLEEYYGCFVDRDGNSIISINMEESHEINLIKYDILGLKNVGIIRDTCRFAGIPYPKSYKVDWDDDKVWEHMTDSPVGIFQFESDYAFDCLKKMNPHKLNDMSMCNAALRPSGESYREDLFSGVFKSNPSEQIDELLKDNRGYLCIAKDSMVSTVDGLVPIQNINIGDMVYTSKGLERVTHAQKTGVKDVYKLNTLYTELKCTHDHQILTPNGYKRLDELETGDVIALRVGTDSNDIYNHDLLKILGWHLGDGCYANGSAIHITNANINVVNSYKESIERVWDNLTLTISDVKSRVSKTPLYRGLVVWKGIHHNYDKPIHHFFAECGLAHKVAKDKHIPEFIFGLNRESLLTFLGAYTDTDSCIKQSLQYKTGSRELAYGLVEVIRRIGYLSNVWYEDSTDSYAITIRGGRELVSELYEYSVKIRDEFPNRDYIRIESVVKISDTFDLGLELLDNINNIRYVKITDIEYAGVEDVYDLTVGTTHDFVANGVVVHNCFQEDTIKFLTNICGLDGGEADNVRRAIGRKQTDRLQKALPSILDGYCKNSPKPREIAEEEAKEFLQIIEDSSNYQFGYNHSTAYSMIGYTCAMLRYYYPVEFCSAFLNNANNEDDIKTGTKLANQLNIKILPIKFGKSSAFYTPSPHDNTIYKGIASIKYCNEIIADELMEVYNRHHDNFLDILKDIKENTSVNSRQLGILITLDFFSEYGNNQMLLNIVEVYDKFAGKKTIKKDKLEELGISEFLAKKHSTKETAKQFSGIDGVGLVRELVLNIPNKRMPLREQVEKELEYLGYIDSIIPELPDYYHMVVAMKTYKDSSKPYVTMRQLSTGEEVKTRIKQGKLYEADPFTLYDILVYDDLTLQEKVRKNDAGKWVGTGEFEPVLTAYSVLKDEY